MSKLTIDMIEVPEGMLHAGESAAISIGAKMSDTTFRYIAECILRAALHDLAENPIEPTDDVIHECARTIAGKSAKYRVDCTITRKFFSEWQRRMFLRKQDPLPDEVKELIAQPFDNSSFSEMFAERIRKAYELGKKERV